MDVELRNDRVQRIGSNAHQLYTYDTNKLSLCPFVDKRYVLDDKINTLAYGHYNVKYCCNKEIVVMCINRVNKVN